MNAEDMDVTFLDEVYSPNALVGPDGDVAPKVMGCAMDTKWVNQVQEL